MRSLYIVVALSLSLATAQFFSAAFTSPLFLWSNANYFVGQNVHINELVSAEEVFRSVKGDSSSFGKYLKQGSQLPEVIVVFVEPELRTEQFPMLADAYALHPNGGAFSKLKGTLESYASSSVVIPYSHSTSSRSTSSIVASLIASLPSGASVTIAKNAGSSVLSDLNGVDRATYVTLEQLKDIATNNWKILSNGVPDLVIVGFESPAVHPENLEVVSKSYAADDAYMNTLLLSLGGNYVAVFTADKPVAEHVKQSRAIRSLEQLAAVSSDDSIFPKEVIEALIVMIPFLFILSIGICCTFGVQSNLKFDAELDNKKK